MVFSKFLDVSSLYEYEMFLADFIWCKLLLIKTVKIGCFLFFDCNPGKIVFWFTTTWWYRWGTNTIDTLIVSITKCLLVIGSVRAYLLRNCSAVTWVSNYSCPRKESNNNYHSMLFSFLFIGREPTTWPANNCPQISVLLQIIFCSCVIETTFSCGNGRWVPRAVRDWFYIWSWSKEPWEY